MGHCSGAGSSAGVGQAGLLGRPHSAVQAAHGLAARSAAAVLQRRSREHQRQVRCMTIERLLIMTTHPRARRRLLFCAERVSTDASGGKCAA